MDQEGVIKYVITKIEDQPHILCISKCNFCPFFSLDTSGFDCFCHREEMDNKRLISKVNSVVYAYPLRYTTFDVKRPDWCGLDEFLIGGDVNKNMYYRTGNNTISCEKIDNPEEHPILFDTYLKYSKGKIVKDNKKIEKDNFIVIDEQNKNICSCCGSKKNDVDRNKNLGMCDECCDMVKHHSDDETMRFIYINNFRLKRKSTYSNTKFKKISDDSNFYDKIVV